MAVRSRVSALAPSSACWLRQLGDGKPEGVGNLDHCVKSWRCVAEFGAVDQLAVKVGAFGESLLRQALPNPFFP